LALTVHGGNGTMEDSGNDGGPLYLTGGSGNNGGPVVISGGGGAAANGSITINHGASSVVFNSDGTLIVNATAAVTEDVVVKNGDGNSITLHYVNGIYTGHTGP
jgi:hypothetical protein